MLSTVSGASTDDISTGQRRVSLPQGISPSTRAAFDLSLASANKRPNTIKSYLEAVDPARRLPGGHGMPRDVENIRREHVEASQRPTRPAQAGLGGEPLPEPPAVLQVARRKARSKSSPMANMKPPGARRTAAGPEDDQLNALIKASRAPASRPPRQGHHPGPARYRRPAERARRDGSRTSTGPLTPSVDDRVTGKGDRPRTVALGQGRDDGPPLVPPRPRPSPARRMSRGCGSGRKGQLTTTGVAQMLRRRGARRASTTSTRIASATRSPTPTSPSGGQEGDLMRLAGWSIADDAPRYGASAATERAIAAGDQSPVDRCGSRSTRRIAERRRRLSANWSEEDRATELADATSEASSTCRRSKE